MIFGQIDKSYEDGALPFHVGSITCRPHMFSQYSVQANEQCVEEHVTYAEPAWYRRMFKGLKHREKRTLVPSKYVYLKDNVLTCHPDVAQELERLFAEHTARVLDRVEMS